MVEVDEMPQSMADVVEAIGASAALSVVRVYAGSVVYVPRQENMTEAHPLARLLGLPLALKLAAAVGGAELRLPRCEQSLSRRRDEQIAARLGSGETVGELARAYGVTERFVRMVQARVRAMRNR